MLSPADLYEIRKIVVSSKLLDSGAFDAELVKIEAGIQAATDAQTAAQVANNDKFVTQAAKLHDDLDAKEASIRAQLADIATRSAALDAKQTEYNATAADVGAKLDALAAAQQQAHIDTDALYASANSKMNAAAAKEQELAAREATLIQGQQDLATKLAALKAISA